MLGLGDEVAVIAFVEAVMHNSVAPKSLFGKARLVHPVLVPVPLKKAAVNCPAGGGEKFTQNWVQPVILFLPWYVSEVANDWGCSYVVRWHPCLTIKIYGYIIEQ